jgi:hypothetical protein
MKDFDSLFWVFLGRLWRQIPNRSGRLAFFISVNIAFCCFFQRFDKRETKS